MQRVYVHRGRFDEFVDAFTEEVAALRVGDPLDPADRRRLDGRRGGRRAGASAGRRRRCAGGAPGHARRTRDGATRAADRGGRPAAPTRRSWSQEVFGALVAVLPFDDFDDVLATCNDSRFGLQAGLFTRDLGRILTAWRDLQVGGLVVNGSSNFRLDHVPFGGVKDSGFGRESPRCMIEDYTVVKTLMLRGMSIWERRTA